MNCECWDTRDKEENPPQPHHNNNWKIFWAATGWWWCSCSETVHALSSIRSCYADTLFQSRVGSQGKLVRKGGEKWRCSLTFASTAAEQKEGPFLNSAHPPPVLLSYVYTRRDDDGPKFSAVFFRPKTLAKTLRVFCMLTHMSGIPLLCYVHSVCTLFFILLENR